MIIITIPDVETAIAQGQKLIKAAKAKVGNGNGKKKKQSSEKLKKYAR